MTTKEAEVTKTKAAMIAATKSYHDALADRAEEIKAGELPEVWYIWDGGLNGWHFAAGSTKGEVWDNKEAETPSLRSRESLEGAQFANTVTKAEHDNARALYHGADFTGRLDENTDTTFGELNKATRDELGAYERRYIEFFNTAANKWDSCAYFNPFSLLSGTTTNGDIYRLRAPKTRPMTRREVLAWAASADAFGWVVRCETEGLRCPQQLVYDMAIRRYQRAQINTLNDDGTGGTWEAFEVPAK